MASVERASQLVEAVLKEALGDALRVRCVVHKGEKLEKKRTFPARTDKKTLFDKLLNENQKVQDIVKIFDAEFVK